MLRLDPKKRVKTILGKINDFIYKKKEIKKEEIKLEKQRLLKEMEGVYNKNKEELEKVGVKQNESF